MSSEKDAAFSLLQLSTGPQPVQEKPDNRPTKDIFSKARLVVRCKDMSQFFAVSKNVSCLRPGLRLSFFADSHNSNVNGTPNFITVRQIIKRADTAGFRQCSCTAQRTFYLGY